MKILATLFLALSLPGTRFRPPLLPPVDRPVAHHARKGGVWYMAESGHAVFCYGPVLLLKQADAFNALLQLSGALCGYLYVKFAPRRGFAYGVSESYFGLRNNYYRWKRRRAARKFEVYMRKQNREVHFDKDGRYVDPDELKKNPNDKRWMN